MPYIVTGECILCGACVSGCESDAITEGDIQSEIDVAVCVECGTCMRNCPVQAIIFMSEEDYSKFCKSQEKKRLNLANIL